MREADLKWYEANRSELAARYHGQWLVIHNAKVIKTYPTEVEAIEYSLREFEINEASVLQAVVDDPFVYLG